VSAFNVVNLGDGQPVDLAAHLEGSWGPARLIHLDAGAAHDFDATDAEICVFVIDGEGTVAMGDTVAASDTGVGITLTRGSTATITATRPMQVFAAWFTVGHPA
jgi:hypothetical protein